MLPATRFVAGSTRQTVGGASSSTQIDPRPAATTNGSTPTVSVATGSPTLFVRKSPKPTVQTPPSATVRERQPPVVDEATASVSGSTRPRAPLVMIVTHTVP